MKNKYWIILVFLPFIINWIGNFSSPEEAFESLLSAAKSDDINNFIECCDLEAMAGITGTEENKEKIINSLKEDLYRKKILKQIFGYLSLNTFQILEKTQLSSNMIILTIKNCKTEETARLVFTEKDRKWKLSNAKLK